MRTIYITESQKKSLEKYVKEREAAINEYYKNGGNGGLLLTEENSNVKKKVKEIIRQYSNPYLNRYLDTPLSGLPDMLKQQLNPGGTPTAMWRSVENNPNENKFIDFLKINLYDQLGTKRDKGPWEYVVGAARILCQDLGFYSFDPSVMRGGDIIRFSKMLRTIHKNKDFFFDGAPDLDRNMNGMNYQDFMSEFAEKYEEWRNGISTSIRSEEGEISQDGDYTIVAIGDRYNGTGCVPTGSSRTLLNSLDNYTDWCICGQLQDFEYPQYTGGGGKVYIMLKNGYKDIPKQEGDGCPLDEYGLSLICVIVGPDGMPDNITTRWNHEHGGENPEGLMTALDLQRVTKVRYFKNFKPRSSQSLSDMHINESEEGNSQYVKLYHVEPSDRGRTEKEFARTGLWLSHFPDDSYGEIAYVYEVPKSIKIADEDTAVKFAVKYNREDLEYLAKMAGLDLEDGDTVEDAKNEYLINPEMFLSENDWAGRLKESGYDGFEFEYGEYTYYYLFNPSVAKLCGKFDCEDWRELRPTLFEDSKGKPSAMNQVHNKVNAGIMDAVTCGGTMEEGAEPESDEYHIGGEGGNNEYFHAINEEKIGNFDFTKYFKPIADFMEKDGLSVQPYPAIKLDWKPQDGLFIKTGYYEPESNTIVIFCDNRHPKDILRTFCHEMIHHSQNLDGVDLNFNSNDDVKDNERLEKIESEAYLKGNVYFRKWTEYQNKGNDILQEGVVNEDTDPDDIDLSSFNIKTALNPKFWKDERLDSRVRMRLLDIADDFIDFLGVNWVKPEDIIMTGSLANYNWHKKFSDVDLHIVMDFSKVDKRTNFVKDYFDSKKNLWNESHKDLSICGFPVELYVQDSSEKHSSTGVYSLEKDKWLTEPNRSSLKSSKINKKLIQKRVSEYIDKIDKVNDIYKKADNDSYNARKASEEAEKLWDDIKKQRKEGLAGAKNEITNGNIVYKCLRRIGYIDKLFSIRDKSYDKVNSIDESNEKNIKKI